MLTRSHPESCLISAAPFSRGLFQLLLVLQVLFTDDQVAVSLICNFCTIRSAAVILVNHLL